MSLFLDIQLTEELTVQPGQIWRTLLSETIISFHLLYIYIFIYVKMYF